MVNPNRKLRLCILSLFCALPLFSANPGNLKKVAVLPSSDSSPYGLAAPLQQALDRLYKESGQYQPSISNEVLREFTPDQVIDVLNKTTSDTLSFVSIEPERIAVFLFDRSYPNRFIVSSKSLSEIPPSKMDSGYIEKEFRTAFSEVIQFHKENRFQDLPSVKAPPQIKVVSRIEKKEKRKPFRFYGGAGALVSSTAKYQLQTTGNDNFFTGEYADKMSLHYNVGLTAMVNPNFGFDLVVQSGQLSNERMKGHDRLLSLSLAPRVEINLAKKLRLCLGAGLRLNRVNLESTASENSTTVIPDRSTQQTLSFAQSLGFQYQMSESFFMELSGTHQKINLKDVSADFSTQPSGVTGKTIGQIQYETWITHFNLGVYF